VLCASIIGKKRKSVDVKKKLEIKKVVRPTDAMMQSMTWLPGCVTGGWDT